MQAWGISGAQRRLGIGEGKVEANLKSQEGYFVDGRDNDDSNGRRTDMTLTTIRLPQWTNGLEQQST
jgi:hypothetical protein